MKKIAVLDKNLKEVKSIDLNDNVFDIQPKETLIHQVVVSMLSNLRRSTAHTKTKAEVRGGGKKPWKQKGTGRARAGSRRSPLWIGGGITFGPRNVINWQKKINQKMRQKAFCMVLTNKLDNNLITVVENFDFDKTKSVNDFINKANFAGKKTLFCLDTKNEAAERVIRNIENVKVTSNLNVLELLKSTNIVMEEALLNRINEKYSKLNFKNK